MNDDQPILDVTTLNQTVNNLLKTSFRSLRITGEISNLRCLASGYIFFSLKDQYSQVRCALFYGAQRKLPFILENGQAVLLEASVSLYTARGDFQLVVSDISLAGDGQLQIAFEKLKKKLAAEGLFSTDYKKPLPEFPRCIGVIASASSAAIRDVLTVLRRRFHSIPAIVYPSSVQGQQACAQLINAIQLANQRQECDVLIIARGGGSLEDLQAFNEESVARAVFASTIPIISGVGHEIDFTITDMVADLRAATPSAAAEHAVPDSEKYQHLLMQIGKQLQLLIKKILSTCQTQLMKLQHQLRHPGQRIQQQQQQLTLLKQQLLHGLQSLLSNKAALLQHIQQQLLAQSPAIKIEQTHHQLATLQKQLQNNLSHYFSQHKQQLAEYARTLDALSPLNTLQRGYAIARQKSSGEILRDANQVKTGDLLSIKLARGEIDCVASSLTAELKGL